MRKPLLIVFLFYLSGIAFYNENNLYIFSAVVTALFLMLIVKKQKYLGACCIAFFLFGAISTYIQDNILENRYKYINSLEELEGYVLNVNESLCTLKNYQDNYCVILSLDKLKKLKPGDYINFRGETKPRPDYKKILMYARGIDAYISCKSTNIRVLEKSTLRTLPFKIRFKLSSALSEIDLRGGTFISGLITGYTNDITDLDADSFSELGISHILAVSGFNIGIIYFFLTILLGRISARIRYLVILGTCFLYTAVGAFEPSITRAFIMIAVAVTAKLLNRYHDILNGIVLTAFVMLLLNPYILYNIGFQLSFLATAGIILLKDDIKDNIPDFLSRNKDEISIALSALISVFPLIIWYQGVLSIFYLIINILLSPIIAFTTIMGFATAIIFLIFNYKIVLYPAVFTGLAIVKIIGLIVRYNYLIYFGKSQPAFIVLYYSLISLQFRFIKIINLRFRKIFMSGLLLLMIATLVFSSKDLKIHMINVGQGDSMLIETPSKKLILIDTGPEFKDYSAAEEKVIPYIKKLGYRKIDLLILTHFHNDHAGGLGYIQSEMKIDKIAASENNEKIKLPIIKLSKGDNIYEDGLILKVLLPEEMNSNFGGNNENCLVMELSYKDFSMLLTSDAEKNDMDTIPIKDYDVLKVSHHGSYSSYNSNLVDNSEIRTALISVGRNSFGHPSSETIESLKANGVDIYRTDLHGDIVLSTNGESYELSTQ